METLGLKTPIIDRYRFKAGNSTFHAHAKEVFPSWHSFSFTKAPGETPVPHARPVMRSAAKALAVHLSKHRPDVVAFSGSTRSHERLYHYLIHRVDSPVGYVPHMRSGTEETTYALVKDSPEARSKAAASGYRPVKMRGKMKLSREPEMPLRLARTPASDLKARKNNYSPQSFPAELAPILHHLGKQQHIDTGAVMAAIDMVLEGGHHDTLYGHHLMSAMHPGAIVTPIATTREPDRSGYHADDSPWYALANYGASFARGIYKKGHLVHKHTDADGKTVYHGFHWESPTTEEEFTRHIRQFGDPKDKKAHKERLGKYKFWVPPETPEKLARLPLEDMSPAARAAHALLTSAGAPESLERRTPTPRKPIQRAAIATTPVATPEERIVTPRPKGGSDYLTKLMGRSGRKIIGADEVEHVMKLHGEGWVPLAIADHLARHFPDRETPSHAVISRIVKLQSKKAETPLQRYAVHLASLGYPAKNIRLLLALHPESKAQLPKPLRE